MQEPFDHSDDLLAPRAARVAGGLTASEHGGDQSIVVDLDPSDDTSASVQGGSVSDTLGTIAANPGRFAANLVNAAGEGVRTFGGNIARHLAAGVSGVAGSDDSAKDPDEDGGDDDGSGDGGDGGGGTEGASSQWHAHDLTGLDEADLRSLSHERLDTDTDADFSSPALDPDD